MCPSSRDKCHLRRVSGSKSGDEDSRFAADRFEGSDNLTSRHPRVQGNVAAMAENCEDARRFQQQQNGDPSQQHFQQQYVFPAEQLPSVQAMMMQLMASMQQIVQQVQEQNTELMRMFSPGGVEVPWHAGTSAARYPHCGGLDIEDRAQNLQVESRRLLGLQCANERIKPPTPQVRTVQDINPLGPECSGKKPFPMKRGREEEHVDVCTVVTSRELSKVELNRISRRRLDTKLNDTVCFVQPWWQVRFPGSRSTLSAVWGPSLLEDDTISDNRFISFYNLLYTTEKSSQYFSRDCEKRGHQEIAVRFAERAISQRSVQSPHREQSFKILQFATNVTRGKPRKKFCTYRPRLRPRTRWKVESSSECEPTQIWCHIAIAVYINRVEANV